MKCMEEYEYMIRIIASHFTNYEVNSSYCSCKVVNHEKSAKQFFPKESLIFPHYIFPHYVQIISTFYSPIAYYYQKKILFIPKVTSQNAKNASQFFKKNFRLRWAKILAALGIFIAK